MLREGTTDTGSVFRTKGDTSSTFVLEVVHLFRHDISGITEAQKNAKILKHRRNNAFVSSRFDNVCELASKCTPATRLGRKDVSGTRTGLE
jgi:hypothetical protein